MQIPILYEDKDVVAVDKPAGLMVHPDGRQEGPFLTDWIIEKYPKTKNVGEVEGSIDRPGIVHRLDKETSGVMLVAKTKASHKYLKEQFQNRTIVKKYLAFARGEIKDQYGTINRSIGKSPKDFRRWSATRGARGEMREAETWYELIAYRSGYSFLEIEPKTGRTINHPIVADSLYGSDETVTLGFGRLALHAYSVDFATRNGKRVIVKAPLPPDFISAIEELGITEVAKKRGLC
jgi:23S rRNA pseudouridine1911/1915/1917 synthase